MGLFSARFFARWMPAVIGMLWLMSCGGGDGTIAGTAGTPNNNAFLTADSTVPAITFAATLTSAQEVPPTAGTATGTGVVIADPATRNFKATIATSGIAGTMAHIHLGAPGVSGAIVFPMLEIAPGSGIWITQGTMTDAQFSTLVAGNYYFNVHSVAFQNGEIRGQILTQLPDTTGASTTGAGTTGFAIGTGATGTTSAFNVTTFVNVLTGAQQVPATSSAATAISVAILARTTKTLTVTITAMGINGIAAHVHDAAPVNAPIVFVLGETTAGSGIWVAKVLATDTQISALLAGNYYLDIHTAAFPDGEIRGRIVPTTGTGVTGTGFNNGTGTGPGTTGTTGAAGIGTTASVSQPAFTATM